MPYCDVVWPTNLLFKVCTWHTKQNTVPIQVLECPVIANLVLLWVQRTFCPAAIYSSPSSTNCIHCHYFAADSRQMALVGSKYEGQSLLAAVSLLHTEFYVARVAILAFLNRFYHAAPLLKSKFERHYAYSIPPNLQNLLRTLLVPLI